MSNYVTSTAKHQPTETAPYEQGETITAPHAIRDWIRNLPLSDQRATVQLTATALRRLNKSRMPIDERARALALFTPLINTLFKRLAQYYARSQRPVTPEKREHFKQVQAMLNEVILGYLIIITDSPLPSPLRAVNSSERHNARRVPVGSDTHHLCNALYQAIEHLAQCLLHSHLLYTTPAPTVWSEIHRLYYIAETYNIPATPFCLGLNPDLPQNRLVSIDHAYKRILLFSLANPYHLMPHEMSRAYQSLRRWAPQCKIIRSDSPEKLQGRFYIDLESDLPPTHHTLNQLDLELPSLRLLDIAEILPSERYQRALDRRLAQAIIVRPERLTRRNKTSCKIMLAHGLATCHHLIANEGQKPATSTLQSEPEHAAFAAQQKDSSLGGLSLRHQHSRHYLPTGALITYRSSLDAQEERWNIGTVRWYRNHSETGHELGIKCLAEDGSAVLTQTIDSDGNQTAPTQQALLTPAVDPLTHPTTLITPANQYQPGDTIQIHNKEEPFQVELTQLIEATWAYNHYRFSVVTDHTQTIN